MGQRGASRRGVRWARLVGAVFVAALLLPTSSLPAAGPSQAIWLLAEGRYAGDLAAGPATHQGPADPLYPSQYALPLIGAPMAWDRTVGGPSLLVAVLDTGLDLGHQDLDSQWIYASGRGPAAHVYVTAPSAGCATPTTPDDDGWRNPDPSRALARGTHLAGIVAAESTISGDPAVGIAGIAPGATLLPVKVLDCAARGSFTDLASGIEFAAGVGARVILAGAAAASDTGCPSSLQASIDDAIGRGAVVVAPAGDDGTAAVRYPAGCAGVLGVGATDGSDGKAPFSAFNLSVDLVAPGMAILSAVRNTDGLRDYASASGTAMAAAHVAGCAALVRSANASLTPGQVEGILRETARDLGAPGRDDLYGSGRIECGAAVERAASLPGASPTAPSTATATATPSMTAASSPTPSAPPASPTETPVPTGTATAAPTPTATPTNVPATTPGATTTRTSTATGVPSSTGTPTAPVVAAPSATATASATAEATPTSAPTKTPTATPLPVSGPAATATVPPATPGASPTPTASAPTRTPTATPMPVGAPAATATAEPATPGPSPTPTASAPAPTPISGARRFEDNSSSISYSSGWSEEVDGAASAGHFRRASAAGATASLSFATSLGGTVTFGSIRSSVGGRADVALDGVFLETVDLYGAGREYGYTATYAAPSGNHRLQVVVRADRHPSSGGTEVVVDYFDVVAPTPTGTPSSTPRTPSPTAPSTGTRTPTGEPTRVATPSATAAATSPPTSTPTPPVEPTPAAAATPVPTSPAPTDATAGPTPTLRPGSARFEDNSSAITFSAGWVQVLDGDSSAGHYRRSAQAGASATLAFTTNGGFAVWGAIRGPFGGKADVALDGVFQATVDLYAPRVEYRDAAAYPVSRGRHSLRVTVRGDRNPSSTGTDVTVDYFEVAEPVGGRGFGLRREPAGGLEAVVASWAAGTAQTGYLLGRLSPSGATILPTGGTPMPARVTAYTDVSLLLEPVYCYVLFPLLESRPDGPASSDVLCVLPGTRSGTPPGAFTLRLNESSQARLSWAAPALPSGRPEYVLVAVGGSARAIRLAADATSASDDTGGVPTCYVLFGVLDGESVGNTDALCGIPGLSRL